MTQGNRTAKSPGAPRKTRSSLVLLGVLGVLAVIVLFATVTVIAAQGQITPTATIPPRPTHAPSPTPEITPVPLILTPIATPIPLPPLPPLIGSRSSRALALAGQTLVTVNADSGSVTLVDVNTLAVLAEIAVGRDPRTAAITPDGRQALVTLRGDDALAVVNIQARRLEAVYPACHMPYGVVADARRAYVACFADDQIAVFDLASGQIVHRLGVPDAPAGLALSENGWLLATHFYSGQVTALNVASTPFVLGSVNVEPDAVLSQSIVLAPDGTRAYLPQTRTGLALISLQYMQDWFPVVGVLDLTTMQGDRDARLTISRYDEQVANMPFDAAFSPDGATLYVALAGSDAVLAVDVTTYDVRARVPVGANPRAVIAHEDRVFALNALDGTLSIIDASTFTVTDTVRVTDIPLDPVLLRGKVLFHNAADPRLSDGAISCATCHFDGGMDTRTWINFRAGPRNTPVLAGAAAYPPFHWAGDMAELQDSIEDTIRHVMLGDGLIDGPFDATVPDAVDAGRSADLDALAAYVASLETWPNPYRQPDGSLTESARRGMQLFMSGSPSCSCHAPPLYTDQRQHNLAGATFSMEVYGNFDTPTLRGLWMSAPYMHDGVAQTLEEVLTRTDPVHSVAGSLTRQELEDLIAFLLSL